MTQCTFAVAFFFSSFFFFFVSPLRLFALKSYLFRVPLRISRLAAPQDVFGGGGCLLGVCGGFGGGLGVGVFGWGGGVGVFLFGGKEGAGGVGG